jgi:hypothetical protein
VARIYDGQQFLLSEGPAPMTLSLAPGAERVERVRVRFVTPTELKSGQQLAERPEFGVLAQIVINRSPGRARIDAVNSFENLHRRP